MTALYASRRWLVGLLLVIFALACIRFALAQDIWIDESTQLFGVRLPLGELVGWLSGIHANRFGVPGDRMPPLAYLLDHVWWQVAGDAVTRFRLFHVALAAVGVALLAFAEIRALGGRWLGVGAVFLVLSPKLIETAAELRSYPLFFAATCALIVLFLDLLKRGERPVGWGKLVLFGIGCVVISYIHFFGVVAAFSFFATLVLAFGKDRTSLMRVLLVGVALALCLTGLYPFIFGASSISTSGSGATTASLSSYIPLLFGHPAFLIYPVAALLYFGASAVLLLAATCGVVQRALQRRSEPVDWLLVVAIIGCAATILPGFLISSFSALKPSYSIWLLPVFALVLSLGASKPIGWNLWDCYGRAVAVAALLVGAAIATGTFLARPAWFAHGPHRAIEAVREASASPTAIIYGEPGTFAYGYFPMVYQSQDRLPQWLAKDGGIARLTDNGISPETPLSAVAPYRGLLVVDIQLRRYTDLRACLHGHCPAFGASPLVETLVRSGQWSVAAQQRSFGFYDALVTRLIAASPRPTTIPPRQPAS